MRALTKDDVNTPRQHCATFTATGCRCQQMSLLHNSSMASKLYFWRGHEYCRSKERLWRGPVAFCSGLKRDATGKAGAGDRDQVIGDREQVVKEAGPYACLCAALA